MELTSIPSRASTSTTQADNHDYTGHKETASLTTVATTCVILVFVIGVGVVVLFCKRFVESRNSASEDEDLCPETRSSPSSDDVIDKSHEPPTYDDVINSDANFDSSTKVQTQRSAQVPINHRTPQNDETRSQLSTNKSNTEISRNSSRYVPRYAADVETSRQTPVPTFVKRKVNRSTSETLVYIPYRISWSEQDRHTENDRRVDPKASKSCYDIDVLPSYEDAITLCQKTLNEA